jgi:hypothetical protein
MSETVYRHTPDMGEISGFGGGYEAVCQDMLEAGMRWIFDHPEAGPEYKGSPQIFGVVLDNNAEAKALDGAILAGAKGEATGAMHYAVVLRCLAAKRLGWEEYCRQCREHEAKETAVEPSDDGE